MNHGQHHPRLGLLAAGVLLATGGGSLAQEESPVVVERQGPQEVRAGERFEYQLEVRNQSEVPVKDVEIDEFVPPSRGQQQTRDQQARSPEPREDGRDRGQSPQQRQDPAENAQARPRAQQRSGQDTPGQENRRQSAPGDQEDRSGAARTQQMREQRGGEIGVSRTIPYLAPGESQTISVSGVAREEGTIQSCLAVDYTPAVCSSIEVVKADVSLSCSMQRPDAEIYQRRDIEQGTFYACDQIPVTCRITNEGSAPTRPSRLRFELPSGLQPAEGTQASTQIGTIEPGQTSEETLRIQPRQPGEYELQPRLETERGNMTAEGLSLRVIQPEMELALQSPDRGYLDRPVEFTVHLRNPGEVPIPRASLQIEPPEQLENVSVSSESGAGVDGTYEIGTLDPGAARTLTISGQATEAGTATMRAGAEGYCVQAQQKTAEVELQGVPALVLVAYDEKDPVTVGGETIYDIKVRNQGTAPAESIQLTGQLGEQFQFVEGGGRTEISGSGTSFEMQPVQRLEPGESAGWTVTAKANASGYSQLDLTLESTAIRRDITAQEPTRVIQ